MGGWVEENEAVRMSYCELGVGWVGGWVGGGLYLGAEEDEGEEGGAQGLEGGVDGDDAGGHDCACVAVGIVVEGRTWVGGWVGGWVGWVEEK